MNSRIFIRYAVLCFIILTPLADIRAAGAVGFCDPRATVKNFIDANYERAEKLNIACIEHYDLESVSSPNAWIPSSQRDYHTCVGSQIAAEEGRLLAAKDMLETCKQQLQNLGASSIIAWPNIVSLTEGFYLERAGKDEEAESYYQQNKNEHTLSRLAILALKRNDNREAIDWASKALAVEPQNLTALIVLAAVTDTGTGDNLARDAISPLVAKGVQTNQFMPAYYSEVWWAKTWLAATGKIGAMPQPE